MWGDIPDTRDMRIVGVPSLSGSYIVLSERSTDSFGILIVSEELSRWVCVLLVPDTLFTALLTGTGLTPVHFFSHGSTMMLGEESESADYWKKCGDEALARNINGVIIMVRRFIHCCPLNASF